MFKLIFLLSCFILFQSSSVYSSSVSIRPNLVLNKILHKKSIEQNLQEGLLLAIESNDRDAILRALVAGAEVDKRFYQKNINGECLQFLTAVHIAVIHGNHITLTYLIEAYITIQRDKYKKEALEKLRIDKESAEEIVVFNESEKFIPSFDFLLLKDHPYGRSPFSLALERYSQIKFEKRERGIENFEKESCLKNIITYLIQLNDLVLLQQNNHGRNPFHLVAKANDLELLDYFLTICKDPEAINKLDNSGMTPLESASRLKYLEIADILVTFVSGLEKNSDLSEVFLSAVKLLRCDLVIYFCEKYKENPEILLKKDKAGNSILHLIVSSLVTKIQRKSIMTAAEISRRKSQQESWKSRNQGVRALKALIEALAILAPEALNEKDADGQSALHIAVKGGILPAVRYLIENGADCRSKDRKGLTPWGYLKKVRTGKDLTVDEFEIRQLIKDATFCKFKQWFRSLKNKKFRPEVQRFLSRDHDELWAQGLKKAVHNK